MKASLSLALLACAATAIADPKPVIGPQDWFRLSVSIKSLYDSKIGPDIDHSHVTIQVGNRSFKDVVDNFNRYDYRVQDVWEFSVKLSGAPTLMRDYVENQLDDQIEQQVALARASANKQIGAAQAQGEAQLRAAQAQLETAVKAGYAEVESQVAAKAAEFKAAVPSLVSQAIAADPTYGPIFATLPKAQQDAIRAHVTDLVKAEGARRLAEGRQAGYDIVAAKADAGKKQIQAAVAQGTKQLAAGRAEADRLIREGRQQAIDRVHHRLDSLQLETSIQEVAIRYGHMVNGGKGIVYIQVGKFLPETGGVVDADGKTAIDRLRPVNDLTGRLTGTAPTGAVNVGFATYFETKGGNQIKVRTDAYVFHERPIWETADDYIGNIASMSDEEFKREQQFWALNTAMIRVLVETKRFSVYASGAAGSEHSWAGAGFDWEFLQRTHLIVNGYKGDREDAKASVSGYVTRELNPSLTVYVGASRTISRRSAIISTESKFDRTEVVAGVNAKLPKLLPFVSDSTVSLEGFIDQDDFETTNSAGSKSETGEGFRISISGMLGKEGPGERLNHLSREIQDLKAKVDALDRKTLPLEQSLPHLTAREYERAQATISSNGAKMQKLYDQIHKDEDEIAAIQRGRQRR